MKRKEAGADGSSLNNQEPPEKVEAIDEFVDDTSTRKRRLTGTQYLRFNDPHVPSSICPAIVNHRLYGRLMAISDRLQTLFAQKPCWITKALCYEFRDHPSYHRVLLKGGVQRHAYLCYTGPWSRQWIRLGYDPRKDRKSKAWQTLDYRLPKRFRGAYSEADLINPARTKKIHFYKMPAGVTTSSDDREFQPVKDITKADFEIFADDLPPCYNIFAQVRGFNLWLVINRLWINAYLHECIDLRHIFGLWGMVLKYVYAAYFQFIGSQ